MDSPEKPAQNNATTNLGLKRISAEMLYIPRHLQMCWSHLFVCLPEKPAHTATTELRGASG